MRHDHLKFFRTLVRIRSTISNQIEPNIQLGYWSFLAALKRHFPFLLAGILGQWVNFLFDNFISSNYIKDIN